MLRRSFLKTALSSPFVLSLGTENVDFGWVPPDTPDHETPQFCATGRGVGKNVFLYNYMKSALREPMIPRNQGNNPDCVAQAASLGIDMVQAIQHLLAGDTWYGNVSTEMLYAGAKIKTQYTRKKGMPIKNAVAFLKEYGVIFRRVYGQFNFKKYNYGLAKQLLRNTPNSLFEECKKHTIHTFSKITDWVEARDAIENLQPVIVGSTVPFNGARRDKEGFIKPSRGKKWAHAWLLIGIKDHGRKGGCLMNSHGKNWVKGPKSHGQPDGSVWVDQDVLNKMVNQYGDSYAISNFS